MCAFCATEQFQEKVISYQQFSENPSVIDDPNLVVKIGNKYALLSFHLPIKVLGNTKYQKSDQRCSVDGNYSV